MYFEAMLFSTYSLRLLCLYGAVTLIILKCQYLYEYFIPTLVITKPYWFGFSCRLHGKTFSVLLFSTNVCSCV